MHIASDRNLIDARFPVQYVIRPQNQTDDELHDYRGYAGTVAGGVFKPGDEVVVLPSGFTSTIAGIDGPGGDPVAEAFAPMAVTIRLADEIDVSRGDMICRVHNQPQVGQDIDATVCWLSEVTPLRPGAKYTIKHTTRTARALVQELQYRLDVNTLHRDETPSTASPSTRSVGSGCGRSHRCSSTSTGATAPPAASSSSTRPPTPPSPPGCWFELPERHLAPDRGRAAHGGSDGVVHRSLRFRQVDGRGRVRAAARGGSAARPTSSTATTSATGSTATSATPPRTAPRTCAGSATSPGSSPMPAWSRWCP